MSPEEIRDAALKHIHRASDFPPGAADEWYHSGTAATVAQLYAADSNHRHADAVDRAADIQAHMAQVTEQFIAQNQPQQPVEDDTADPSGDR